MTNKFHWTGLSCLVLPLVIVCCGCAPLKVNQPSVFGKFSANAKRLLPGGQSTTDNGAGEPDAVSQPTASSKDKFPSSASEEKRAPGPAPWGTSQRQLNQPGLPALNSYHETPVAQVEQAAYLHELDKQRAYEMGRYDAIQAGYQETMGRTSANPPHPQETLHPDSMAGYSPTYAPQNMRQSTSQHPAPAQHQHGLTAPQPPGNGWQNDPRYEDRGYDDQTSLTRTNQSFPQPTDGLNRRLGEMPASNGAGYNGAGYNGGYDESRLTVPPPAPFIPEQSFSTGHFSSGVNFSGANLRNQVQTATEIALELQDLNEQLRAQLRMKDLELEQFAKKLEAKDQTLNDTQQLLTKSNRISVLLREKIAKLNVNIQDLENENIAIEQNADRALREIELKLDGVLLNSISKSK